MTRWGRTTVGLRVGSSRVRLRSPHRTVALAFGVLAVALAVVVPVAPAVATGTSGCSVWQGHPPTRAYEAVVLDLSVARESADAPVPTGTIDLVDDSSGDVVMTGSLPAGRPDVVVTLPGAAAGVYSYTARYSGDDTYAPCSLAFLVAVNAYRLSGTISLSPVTSPTADQPITFTATYEALDPRPPGVDPDGTVVFTADGDAIGAVRAGQDGVAVLTRTLPAGDYTITAHYVTDDAFQSDNDPSMPYSVNPGGTTPPPTSSTTSTTVKMPSTPTTTRPPRPPVDDVVRLSGVTRVATAVAVSQRAYTGGGAGGVVLAVATDYADALAGGPLAAQRDAPLLLTFPGGLDPEVRTEIRRVLPHGRTVFVLGGTKALPSAIDSQLVADGYRVERYAGADRFETAAVVAERGLGSPSTVFLTTGRDFPDALVAGAAAVHRDAAVLLTDGSAMPTATEAHLRAHAPSTVFAVGGPAAAADPTATPLVGADRFDTSVRVAQTIFPDARAAGLTSGTTFPDSLAAAPHIGRLSAPLLLSTRDELPAPVQRYLVALRAQITGGYVYGGTAAVSAATQHAMVTAIR